MELLLRVKIWQDVLWEDLRGQDLVEYALMSGFVATAAGALMPDVAEALGAVFNKVRILLLLASGGQPASTRQGPVPSVN